MKIGRGTQERDGSSQCCHWLRPREDSRLAPSMATLTGTIAHKVREHRRLFDVQRSAVPLVPGLQSFPPILLHQSVPKLSWLGESAPLTTCRPIPVKVSPQNLPLTVSKCRGEKFRL